MQEKNTSIDTTQLDDINTICLTDLIDTDTLELPPQLPLFSTDLCDMSMTGIVNDDTITLTTTNPGYTTISDTGITTNGNFYDFDLNQYNDVTIQRRSDKPSLQVGELLERISEAYCIPIVSQKELDENPMLQAAFDDWKKSIKLDPEMIQAYEKFQLVQNLCKKDLAAKW